MRIKPIQPFDRFREYQPGERALYRDTVIVAERWTKRKEDLANTPGNLTPLFKKPMATDFAINMAVCNIAVVWRARAGKME